jgi:glutamine---fructose-6-phosphate transaminase (isomerizing)
LLIAEESDFRVHSSANKSGLLVLSQSGETKEIEKVVQLAQRRQVPVISVVNGVASTIANMTKMGVYQNAGPENSATSTKSFTTQVVALALIAMWFRQTKAKEMGWKLSNEQVALAESLQRLPISFGTLMRTQAECKRVAKKLLTKEHCFVLGKGFGEPIAMEGALKLKEVGYLHAEGYSGGALKHGPFAMIEDDNNGKQGATPIIMLVLDDMHAHHMRTACEEVKARGAELIIITDNKKLADGLCDDPIIIPSNGPLTALGAVVPLQMIAYELAMLKDNNPDAPRHLLKTYADNH